MRSIDDLPALSEVLPTLEEVVRGRTTQPAPATTVAVPQDGHGGFSNTSINGKAVVYGDETVRQFDTLAGYKAATPYARHISIDLKPKPAYNPSLNTLANNWAKLVASGGTNGQQAVDAINAELKKFYGIR